MSETVSYESRPVWHTFARLSEINMKEKEDVWAERLCVLLALDRVGYSTL